MKVLRRYLWIMLIALSVTLHPPTLLAEPNVELHVAASSSLTQVMQEMAIAFQHKYPRAKILLNIGAGGALRVQAEQGAPIDVLIGASRGDLEAMMAHGFVIPNTLYTMGKNTLALVLRPGLNLTPMNSFRILKSKNIKKIAVGDPAYVPAGQYAEELLKKLDLYPHVRQKMVFASTVRQALAWVEAGETDAALVYGTDARLSKKITCIVETDQTIDISYGIGVLKQGADNPYARHFVNFVMANEGQRIIRRYGFLPGE